MSTPAPTTPQKTKTLYQVLMLVDFPDPKDGAITSGWMELGPPVNAANVEAALKKNAPLEGSRKLVAVPARSWKPVKVTVEQTTTIKIGDQ